MEWLKKKKEEAKQAAAKIQNKRTAFKGDGHALGGDSDGSTAQAASSGTSGSANSTGFKVPFVKPAPPPISEQEKERRREMQTKAAEARVSAWDKRVNTARKVRLQQEDELENKFDIPPYPSANASNSSSGSTSPTNRPATNVTVLSNDEVKRRELQSAQAQLGFNPYAAVFASSTEVGAATNSIGTSNGGNEAPPATMPPPAPYSAINSSPGMATAAEIPADNGAVYVLLRQEPQRAIAAAETIIKMLNNILQNPQEDKFRRIRLTNATIQTKLVSVPGALDIFREAGFTELPVDGESFLVLSAEHFNSERVQSAVDRTEVALMQLRVDSVGL